MRGLRQRSATERGERSSTVDTADEGADSQSIARTTFVRLGRLLYGGVLTMMAVDGLVNTEGRAEYAAAKGVPAPAAANVASHALLLVGGLGVSLWRRPALAASAAATFFLGVTPTMHDFWNVDDPEQRQQQQINFLKNAALLGAALAFLGLADETK